MVFGRSRHPRAQRTTRTTVATETVPASHHGHHGHNSHGHHAGAHTAAAPHHHQRRRPSLGDKISGAFMKLRGSLTRRPGLKAAGTRRQRGHDGRGGHHGAY